MAFCPAPAAVSIEIISSEVGFPCEVSLLIASLTSCPVEGPQSAAQFPDVSPVLQTPSPHALPGPQSVGHESLLSVPEQAPSPQACVHSSEQLPNDSPASQKNRWAIARRSAHRSVGMVP